MIAKTYKIVIAAQSVTIALTVNIAIVAVSRVIKNLWQTMNNLPKKNGIKNLVVFVDTLNHQQVLTKMLTEVARIIAVVRSAVGVRIVTIVMHATYQRIVSAAK